jgi:nucleotide-binding universal stress UspA family protein
MRKEVMMKRILVPLDGSPLAEQVLPQVRVLAALLGADVHLLHVVRPAGSEVALARGGGPAVVPVPAASWREQIHRTYATACEHATRYLALQATALQEAGIAVTTEVRFGTPADLILETAAMRGASLIAMATHGRSGVQRWALGSVADEVTRSASMPVFITRGDSRALGPSHPLRRMLVPLDGSTLAHSALPFAVELAKGSGAEIVLLTVQALAVPDRTPELHNPVAVRERLMLELYNVADAFGQPQVTITPVVVDGFPADAIVDEARYRDVDMIVMATHGRGGVRRWALGSVADKVLHTAAVPLVLVRAAEAHA